MIRLAILTLLLAGCGTKQVGKPEIPASLLTPCVGLQQLEAGDGKTLTLWIKDAAVSYRLCADKHKRLVEAIKP